MKNIKSFDIFITESIKDKMKGKSDNSIDTSLDLILEIALNDLIEDKYFDGIELNSDRLEKIYDFLSKEYKGMLKDLLIHGLDKYQLAEIVTETIKHEDESFYENIKNMLENDN